MHARNSRTVLFRGKGLGVFGRAYARLGHRYRQPPSSLIRRAPLQYLVTGSFVHAAQKPRLETEFPSHHIFHRVNPLFCSYCTMLGAENRGASLWEFSEI